MRKTAATIFLAFGVVLLVAGAAFAVSKEQKMDPPGEDGENRRVRMELYTPG